MPNQLGMGAGEDIDGHHPADKGENRKQEQDQR